MPIRRVEQFLSSPAASRCGRIPIVTLRPVAATPAMLNTAIRNVVGEAPIRTGKVKLDIRRWSRTANGADDGEGRKPDDRGRLRQERSTSSTRRIRSRTSAISISGRSAGRAQISTRIRLADTPEGGRDRGLSDDTFWPVTAEVVVTLAACTEEVN